MQCEKCLQPLETNSKYCHYCGQKVGRKFPRVKTIFLLFITAFLVFFISNHFSNNVEKTTNIATQPIESEQTLPEQVNEKTRVDMIERAQETVYIVYTDLSQGSAFLYDEYGSVVTNAHVLEGSLEPTIKTNTGKEYVGKVIGYSNETDVAVVYVPELVGKKPFPLEKTNAIKIGQEVIALGTPLGLENTATMGYITGIERDPIIPLSSFTYKNVYQISAPIEPGNSGGPLVSVQDEKIIAINSAKSTDAANIGFSIPIYQVHDLIDHWIENPMHDEEIYALFYHESGDYYFDYLWSLFEGFYFDGGSYTDEELYDYFWEYGDGYWEEYETDYLDYYWYDYDNDYDDWDEDVKDEYDYGWEDEYYDWDEEDYYNWDDAFEEDYYIEDETDFEWDEDFDDEYYDWDVDYENDVYYDWENYEDE